MKAKKPRHGLPTAAIPVRRSLRPRCFVEGEFGREHNAEVAEVEGEDDVVLDADRHRQGFVAVANIDHASQKGSGFLVKRVLSMV